MVPLKPIGILGGMGPKATVDFIDRLVRATPAEDDADHIPLLIDHNPQAPSRIAALLDGHGESPAPVLYEMAARLVSMGVGALAMPCNTAHVYLDSIRDAAGELPVLDMVGLTAERVAASQPARVGLLASSAVQLTGLYDRAFARYGIEVLFPQNQAAVMAAIKAVKRDAVDTANREAMAVAAADLSARGARQLVIACTELSVIQEAIPAELPCVDAMEVLVDAVLAIAGKNRR